MEGVDIFLGALLVGCCWIVRWWRIVVWDGIKCGGGREVKSILGIGID